MNLYVLTSLGRDEIPLLLKEGRADEAKMLKFLDRSEGVTVEQFSYEMNLDKQTARDKLRSFIIERWVWQKITKLAPY